MAPRQLFRLPAAQAGPCRGRPLLVQQSLLLLVRANKSPSHQPPPNLMARTRGCWLARLTAAPTTIHVLCPGFVSTPHFISSTQIKSFPQRPMQDCKVGSGIICWILFSSLQRMHYQSRRFQLIPWPSLLFLQAKRKCPFSEEFKPAAVLRIFICKNFD